MAKISLQEAYDQARRWIESDDPERAIGLAQHILTQYPDNLEAYRILGEAHIADRQLDQSQEAFERVLRSDPENVPAHVGLGITYERQGRLDRAIPEFEQAWEIKPEMTELRSQLLRLYAEAWGSEHAQLRLRGGGLARLYAKGHMLPQAVAEFRKVIDDQPDRYDAKVALAEALWRNGQEGDARDLSRQLLNERSALLKPNLLLGYIDLASGNTSGQQFWDAAHAMDPYEAVAQDMFETLPGSNGEAPMIEEWDEEAWRQQRQQEQQELAATRPIPVPSATETDAVSGSWLDRVAATLPPPPPRSTPVNPAENDDFLAGLLGMDEPVTPTAHAEAGQAIDDEDIALSPFSLNELGLSDDEFASLDTLDQPTSASEQPMSDTNAPFSAADLGLSDDLAGFDFDEPVTDSITAADLGLSENGKDALAPEENALEPFSLADLGLSDDEIAGLNGPGIAETEDTDVAPNAAFETESQASEPESVPNAQHAEVEDLSAGLASGDIQPFSFADLGLSEEELAALDLDEATADAYQTADTEALSEDLLRGQAEPDAVQMNEDTSTPQAEVEDLSAGLASGDIEPFSFADLGLSDDEIASMNLGEDAIESRGEEVADLPEERAAPRAEVEDLSTGLASGDIQPFSFADLGLSDDEIASLNEIGDAPTGSAETSAASDDDIEGDVQPFSLSDLGLSDEELDNLNDVGEMGDNSSRASSVFSDNAEGEYELPVDLQPFSLDELDISASDTSDLSSNSSLPSALQPFSLDEATGNRAETPARPTRPAQEESFSRVTDAPEDESNQQTGGYSWQEPTQRPQPSFVSSMNKEDQGEGASIFAKLKQRKQEEPIEPVQEIPPAANEVDDRLLFSFDDISLRDEEIGNAHALVESVETLAPVSETPPAAAAQPPQDAAAENIEDAVATGEIQPFSLSDLGLSEEEIAALGLGSAVTASAEAQAPQAPSEDASATPDEAPAASTPHEVENLSDALESGEVQPFSFADLGLSDDEIASLDLDTSAASQTNAEAPAASTPREVENLSDALESGEVQPFSFADLGLSDDEIASLGMGEAAQPVTAAEAPAASTPREVENLSDALESGEVQPFSFADLGLSDDEIASLGMGEAAQPDVPVQESSLPPAAAEELDFLADFDLDAAANAEPNTSEQATSAEKQGSLIEDDLQPFSLSDLGLSDDEIDSFGLGDIDSGQQKTSLDLTEDDLAGLDSGTPEWMQSAPHEHVQQPTADMTEDTAVVDRLVSLGQQQGYVDVSDIIAAIGDGETDESRVEEVVQQLQDANIQIRDGDEIIDLTAEEDFEGVDELDLAPPTPASSADEPNLTPFSLAELGLSDEEIALLGLADAEASQVESPAAEIEATTPTLPALSASEEQAAPSVETQSVAATPASPTPAAQGEPELPPALAGYMQQLETDPQNHILRLSIARAVGQAGLSDISVHQYRHLIRQNALLDVIVDDIRDLIDEVEDTSFLQRLHRLLGDAYSRQGRLGEAMTEYAWVAK